MRSPRRQSTTGRYWLIITFVLLLIAASRLLRLHEFRLNPDEVWSVWQTFGTFDQILHWTPYDWPPLYYLTVAVWWRGTSLIPESLRLLSMLIFMLGAAFSYKIGQHFSGRAAGIGIMLVYAALGYNILLSIEVRGYALLLGFMPLALWLLLRYFETGRWPYGVALGLTLAAMFYTSYTSILAIIMLGIYSLVVYGRKVWRWWLPASVTSVLIFQEILRIQQTAVNRVAATSQLETPILTEALYDLFQNWAGNQFILWLILFAVTTGMLLYHQRLSRQSLALLIWVVLMPVLLYFGNSVLGFFSARYAWWVMLGIALWVGWGLAYLPHWPRLVAYGFLVLMLFLPLPMERYSIWGNRVSPLDENFAWLTQHLQTGDLLIADPNNSCGRAEEWDYYTRVYFPTGLHFSATPGEHRRVWYMLQGDRQDADLNQLVSQNRVLRQQVGPVRCLFLLYEAPPLIEGIPFANGLRFHGADIINAEGKTVPEVSAAFHEGEVMRLRLWWTVDQQLDQPYVIGTYIGQRGGRSEALPQVTFPPGDAVSIDQWQPGQYYIEERSIPLRQQLGSDQYPVFLAVLDPQTGERVTGTGLTDENLLEMSRITVKSY